MASIEVSDDVLEKLRAFRERKAETDEQILRRLLDYVAADRARRLKEYQRADQDISSTN